MKHAMVVSGECALSTHCGHWRLVHIHGMDDPNQTPNDEWQSKWLDTVHQLAATLKEMEQDNPWPDRPLLPQAMNYLMTELWDHGFSQTQIRHAFHEAIADMPRYAAGDEVRR
jgi:hypothetical protein